MESLFWGIFAVVFVACVGVVLWFIFSAAAEKFREAERIGEKFREAERLERERVKQEAERLEREKFDRNFKTACKEFLETQGYLQVLVRKRKQLIVKDDYGDWYIDDWFKELERFVENKMQDFRNEWFNDAFVRFAFKWNDDYGRRNLKFTHYLERE
jgi:hypothetical protein